MGGYVRLWERRIERGLAREATVGGITPPPGRSGATASGTPAQPGTRAGIPPLGLREYWYPALPARKVGRRRPLYWRMCGEELCFFRDADGQVAAILDVCPHRGASLSQGRCFYAGTVACPYHGAVFDREGRCRAFITEGPDSTMTGNLSVRAFPTVEKKGWVFVWMGQTEPVDPELDLPPELFEPDSTIVMSAYTYWRCPWILAIENQSDAHNCLYVHRNSLEQLVAERSRKRSPVGPRSTVIEDRALIASQVNARYYEKDGEVPFQMYYPGVDGYWPKTLWRKRLWTLLSPVNRYIVNGSLRKRLSSTYPFKSTQEWGGGGSGPGSRQAGCWHLPCAVRVNTGHWMHTRFAVPVTEQLSRVIYYNTRRTRFAWTRLMLRLWFAAWFKWLHVYNFSGQDARVASPCRYWTEETLAPTDSHLVKLRKLITEGSRDALRRPKEGAAGGPGHGNGKRPAAAPAAEAAR